MPSPSDLEYFVEVSSTLNLSRAAERIGISQPTLSLAIKRLEENVGVPLLNRSKRGVNLTQAGIQLLTHIRELLQRWETVRGQALSSIQEDQGSFTIGCHPAVGIYTLPGFMPDLLEKYPKLDLHLTHDLSRKILERVVSMEIQVGIVVNPVQHADLVIRRLCVDEVTLWVGPGERTIQKLLNGQAVLICDPELIQTQTILNKLKKNGVAYRQILGSSSLEVIAELTASGAGIGILPERVAKFVGGGKLRRVAHSPSVKDEISLVYRVENKGVRALQTIVNHIQKAFGKSRTFSD